MPTALPEVRPAMLDVHTVAAMLSVSRRHIYTMSDSGQMPRPQKLGRVVRWNRAEIEQWIAGGCPRVERQRRS